MKLSKEYITYVIVFFIVLLIGTLSYLKIYICPFYYITGIPCPMCGMTRALFSVLEFNFSNSFYYHALWPLALISIISFFLKVLFKIKVNKKLENTIAIIISIIFLSYYIYRHIIGCDIVSVHFNESLIYKIYYLLFK